MSRRAIVLFVAAAFLAGCGNSSSGSTAQQQAPPKKAQPGDGLKKCVEGLGLTFTRRDATHLQVKSPAGRIVANATVFKTEKEAQVFDDQLEVPDHGTGERVTTVILTGNLEHGEDKVLPECATKG